MTRCRFARLPHQSREKLVAKDACSIDSLDCTACSSMDIKLIMMRLWRVSYANCQPCDHNVEKALSTKAL